MDFDVDKCPVAGVDTQINVLVTGGSSGIGLALVQALLENHHVCLVIAVARSATRSDALVTLQDAHRGRLQLIDADLTSEPDLTRLASLLKTLEALHLVINAAGVLHGPGLVPEKALEQLSQASLERVFAINAFAPLLLAKALLPYLCRNHPVVFASLSARVGSIGDNRSGGWYTYRASKAAQNQLLKTFSIEWKRRNPRGICLLLHPGTVDTHLSAPFQANVPADKLFDAGLAANQLLSIISQSTPADSGRFIGWDGIDVPW